LVAHLHGMQGVRGSNPLSSTIVMSRDIGLIGRETLVSSWAIGRRDWVGFSSCRGWGRRGARWGSRRFRGISRWRWRTVRSLDGFVSREGLLPRENKRLPRDRIGNTETQLI